MKTPCFILNPKIVENNYQILEKTCKKYLKSFRIAYSVKTNSLKRVIQTLEKQGCGMEVASINELKLAKNNKFIVFNSPAKTIAELKIAITKKALINIDSKSEIDKIYSLIKGKRLEIGIRVCLKESKFGISIQNLKEIIDYALSKNLYPICVHSHSGTQLSLSNYQTSLSQLSKTLSNIKYKFKYIDLGGSIPEKQQLKNLNTNLEEYIKKIAEYFNKSNSTIILEPGRFLTADSTILLTSVITIKTTDNTNYAILDAGINLLPKITLANYKFIVPKGNKDYTLAGPLLFNNDILAKIKSDLKEGDIIRVENVGAYCLNLSWPISYDKPRVYIKQF